MTDIVRGYLGLCSERRAEPYYGFIKAAHEGVIDCDLDFVPGEDIRRMGHGMGLAADSTSTSSTTLKNKQHQDTQQAGHQHLLFLRLCRGQRRGLQHPPVRSSQKVPFRRLVGTYGVSSGWYDAGAGSIATGGGKVTSSPSGDDINPSSTTALSTAAKVAAASAIGRKAAASSADAAHGSGPYHSPPILARGVTVRLLGGVVAAVRASCATLRELHLVKLEMDSECVRRLAMDALPGCTSLEVLNLSHNPLMGDQGLLHLATHALDLMKGLRKLVLKGCDLTRACGRGLGGIVVGNRAKEANKAWRQSLRSNISSPDNNHHTPYGITHIDLEGNYIGEGGDGVSELLKALQSDQSITHINLSNNCLNREECLALIEGFVSLAGGGSGGASSSALEYLNIQGNPGLDGAGDIRLALFTGTKRMSKCGGASTRGGGGSGSPDKGSSFNSSPALLDNRDYRGGGNASSSSMRMGCIEIVDEGIFHRSFALIAASAAAGGRNSNNRPTSSTTNIAPQQQRQQVPPSSTNQAAAAVSNGGNPHPYVPYPSTAVLPHPQHHDPTSSYPPIYYPPHVWPGYLPPPPGGASPPPPHPFYYPPHVMTGGMMMPYYQQHHHFNNSNSVHDPTKPAFSTHSNQSTTPNDHPQNNHRVPSAVEGGGPSSSSDGGGPLPINFKVHSRVGSAVSFPHDGQEMSMLNVSGSTAVSNFSPNRTVLLASSPDERGGTRHSYDELSNSHRHRDTDGNNPAYVPTTTSGSSRGDGLHPMSLEEMLLEGGLEGRGETTAAASEVHSNADNNSNDGDDNNIKLLRVKRSSSTSSGGIGDGTVIVRPESGLGWTMGSSSEDMERKLDGMLQAVLGRMELGEEERMIALERMRGDVASHNEHLEELTELLSRHTDRIDELEKENKKVVTAMGGSGAMASAAALASKQSRAVVLRELPRNDQEVLMSNLSMEMALLLSKGLTKMGDLVAKQGLDRESGGGVASKPTTTIGGGGGGVTSLRSAVSAVTAANRFGGGGALSSNNNRLGSGGNTTASTNNRNTTTTPASFEAEVGNRLSQLGW